MIGNHPHRAFLASVARPGRYAGPELGAVPPRPDAEVSLALCFPDVYEVGCSNLGLAILYRRAAGLDWVHVERAFAPWPDYGRALASRRLPLVTRESAMPLGAFHTLGFSLQHELTYTTVLWMLDLAHVPLRSSNRDGTHPLVLAGGPCATNPEPMGDFVDAFCPGDGEDALPSVLAVIRRTRRAGASRADTLRELARLGHVYVPTLYARSRSRSGRLVVSSASPGAPLPVRMAPPAPLRSTEHAVPVVPAVAGVFDRVQVEIARGCSAGCRFCHAGIVYRPVRERSPGEVVEAAIGQVVATGYDEIGLSSLSTADYPALGQVVRALRPLLESRTIALSVASLRAYGLDASVLEAIHAVRATGMTLAPEAGSERLRAVLNKSVTSEHLLAALERLRSLGWQRVKLYFMTGLPGERDEDLEAMAALIGDASRTWSARRARAGLRLSASVSNFVPKPFTPFEREAMVEPRGLVERASRIRRLARGTGVALSFHDPEQSRVEGLLARGGREMSGLVEEAYRLGCRLDGWGEHFDAPAWERAIEEAGIDAAGQAAAIPPDDPLPWSVIEVHVDGDFLAGEARAADRGQETERCDSPLARVCQDCGAPCDPEQAALAGGDDTEAGLGRALALLERADARVDRIWRAVEPDGRQFVSLVFDRAGPASYLGHRDVIRVVGQSLRRAGVPLVYSAGFTPRPRLVFRAALPCCVVGFGEEVCAEVARPLADGEALVERLGEASPDGFTFVSATGLDARGARNVGLGPGVVRWYLPVSGTCLPSGVHAAVASILGAPELARTRRSGKRQVTVDLRPLVEGMRVERVGTVADLAPAGLDPDLPVVVVDARPVNGKWIRPLELIMLLGEQAVEVAWVARRLIAGERSS